MFHDKDHVKRGIEKAIKALPKPPVKYELSSLVLAVAVGDFL